MSASIVVSYIAYEAGSRTIVSEGVIPVQTNNSSSAGDVVRAMFTGMDVVITGFRTAV